MKAPWVSICSKVKFNFQQKPPRLVRWGFHSSPIGYLFFGVDERERLCSLAFSGKRPANSLLQAKQKKWSGTKFQHDPDCIHKIYVAIFERPRFLEIVMVGTAFQQKVWKAISRVKAGQTESYQSVAYSIRNPKAVRAVGTACGANPVVLLVPCHRILAADGGLGGFGGGLPLKIKLLASERQP